MHRTGADSSTQPGVGPLGPPPSLAADGEGGSSSSGHSLAAHLKRADGGEEPRLGAERYADALAAAARSLGELHERGLAQGNIRAESLSFNVEEAHIGLPSPVLGQSRDAPLPAGDPYVAPEQHLGEEGPSIDQYALGVVAREVFTARAAPPPTASLRDVLRRATAPRVEDRYTDIVAFGEALVRAVRGEAPRGLAERLEAVSARSRMAVVPGVLMAALVLGGTLGSARDPLFGPLFTAVLAPLAAGALGVLAGLLVWVAAAIRRPRWPVLPMVQPNWVPVSAVAVVFAVILWRGGDVVADGFEVIVVVYAVRALLAPPPEGSARWLAAPLRRWDTRHMLPTPSRQIVTAVPIAVLLLPVAIGVLWPAQFELPTAPAREYPPVVATDIFRAALGSGEYGYACRRLMTREAAGSPRLCPDVLRWAAAVQLSDPATRAPGRVLGERGALERFGVQELPTPGTRRSWLIIAPGGERQAGAMYTEGASESRVTVLLSRRLPVPASGELRSLWLYETVKRPDGWRIAGFKACDVGPPGSGRQDARCAARNGLSAARVHALLAQFDAGRRRP